MTLLTVALLCLWAGFKYGRSVEKRHAMYRAITAQIKADAARVAEEARERHKALMAVAFTVKFAQRTGHSMTVMPVNQWVRHLSRMTSEVIGSN